MIPMGHTSPKPEFSLELELELIQSHMTQKQVLRGEVGARALRVYVRSWVDGSGKRDKCSALGCWRTKSLWPLMAGSGWSAFFS